MKSRRRKQMKSRRIIVFALSILLIQTLLIIYPDRSYSNTDLQKESLSYRGAFLTPTTTSFENIGSGLSTYRGASLSFVPTGNNGNGSLLLSYGNFVAELSIPSAKMSSLEKASVLSTTSSIKSGDVSGLGANDSVGGIAYVPARGSQSSDLIYWGTYEYYNTDGTDYNSIGFSSTNLLSPNAKGVWHVGPYDSDYSSWSFAAKHGEYIFPVPQSWADTHTNGRSILVGRSRESAGAGGAAGPVLTAIAPINDVNPPPGGTALAATPLMTFDTGVAVPASGTGWQKWRMGGDPDWDFYSVKDRIRDGAWVEYGGKRAIILAMSHGTFDNTNPCTDANGGPGYNGGLCARPSGDTPPWCYGTSSTCSAADPSSDSSGFHAGPYYGRLVFVSVDDIESVAAGSLQPDEVDGYAVYDLMQDWGTPAGTALDRTGSNDPCGIAFDDSTGRLYVCQANGNDPNGHPMPAWPVIHVYDIDLGALPVVDTIPPSRGSASPVGLQPAGTTQVSMSLVTNENSTCRWAESPNVSYASMVNTFSSTGGKTHSVLVSGLQDGQVYNRYIRCSDAAGNVNTNDFLISWEIAQSSGVNTVYVNNLAGLYSAFSNLRSNDEIVISPGVYNLNTTALAIDVPNVTVRGSTGNRDDVIIQGDAMSPSAVIKSIFYFAQGSGENATIKDLTIGRVGWHAIFFNGDGSGNGTVIDNVRIFDCYQQFIKGSIVTTATDDVTVKNSLFEFTTPALNYYTGGIDAHNADGWVVKGNTFKNIQSPSIAVAEHAVHFWSNSSFSGSNTIEQNKIVNCDRGIGIWNGTGTNIIRNNMIANDGSGQYPDVGIDIQNTPNTRVYNNTVWIDPSGYYAAMEFRGETTLGSYIVNNLTNKQISQFNGAGDSTLMSNVTNSQSTWFVDVLAGDLHLSSAVNGVVGSGTAIIGLVDDFDGVLRSGNIDIGADQLSNPILPPLRLKIN
jgi:hypothetical protein